MPRSRRDMWWIIAYTAIVCGLIGGIDWLFR